MANSSFELSAFPPEEAPKASRVCSVTGRAFQLGDKMYSVLYEEEGEIKRVDLCAQAWRGYKRPDSALAWWSARVVAAEEKKVKLTPNDALVALFESLVFKPDQADLRYALALLLVRRRVFRFEFERNEQDAGTETARKQNVVFVYSSRNDACYSVPVVPMNPAKIADVQERLLAALDTPPAELVDDDEAARLAAEAAANALDGE